MGIDPQQIGIAALHRLQQVQRELDASGFDQRAGFEDAPLPVEAGRQIGRPRPVQHAQRRLRSPVGDLDDGEVGGDLALRHAFEAVLDLVIEQVRRLPEQVDLDQPPGQVADHLVAARPGRRQLAKVVVQAQRVDRAHRIGLAIEIEIAEHRFRLLDQRVDRRAFRIELCRLPHRFKAKPIVLVAKIQFGQQLLHIRFERIAAPQQGLGGERPGCLGKVDVAALIEQQQRTIHCLGARWPPVGDDHLAIGVKRFLPSSIEFGDAPGEQQVEIGLLHRQLGEFHRLEIPSRQGRVAGLDRRPDRREVKPRPDPRGIAADHRLGRRGVRPGTLEIVSVGLGDSAPHQRIDAVDEGGRVQNPERIDGPVRHHAGDSRDQPDLLCKVLGFEFAFQHLQHADRLVAVLVGEIEFGQIEPRPVALLALAARRPGRQRFARFGQRHWIVLNQLPQFDEPVALRHRIAAIETARLIDRRHGQTLRRADHRRCRIDCHLDIVVRRLDDEAVHAGQGRKVDEFERADDAARRRIGGDDVKQVADHRIAELMHPGGPLQVGDDLKQSCHVAAAAQRHRFGRHQQHIAQRKHPGAAFRTKRRQPVGRQFHAHDLGVARRGDDEFASDRRQRLGIVGLRDAGEGIKQHPDRVAAPVHRRGGVLFERKHDAQGRSDRSHVGRGGGRVGLRRQRADLGLVVIVRGGMRRIGGGGMRRLLGRDQGLGGDIACRHQIDIDDELAPGRLVISRHHAWREMEGDARAVGCHDILDIEQLGWQVGLDGINIDRHRPGKIEVAGFPLDRERRFGVDIPVELHAYKRRIAADTHLRDRIEQPCLLGSTLLFGEHGRIEGAPRQFGDDFGRQRRGQALPARRHQVDEQLFAGFHAIETERGTQAEAQAPAIRVDAGDADIVGHGRGDIGDRQVDRGVKAHHQDAVFHLDPIGRQVEPIRKAEDQPDKALFVGDEQLCSFIASGGQRSHDANQRHRHGQSRPLPASDQYARHRRPPVTQQASSIAASI